MLPPEHLRTELAAHRAHDAVFADAWPAGLSTALAGLRGEQLEQWRRALGATRAGWEAAYERQPARRRERALRVVAEDHALVDLAARLCRNCAAELAPQALGRVAVYCSTDCRRAFNRAGDVERVPAYAA